MGRTVYEEATSGRRVSSLPMGHLSIELGHLYAEDLLAGEERIREMARRVAPWAEAARAVCAEAVAPQRARVSTCVLIDDYFTVPGSPLEVLPMLMTAAEAAGMRIDYLARESACARAGDVPLGAVVADRLVTEPATGTNGSRPPTQETGWLCNGVRSPLPSGEAMALVPSWQPPLENAANRHSIFVDVELWDDNGPVRQYSCAHLAAVWQLLRLGVIRHHGTAVARPQPLPNPLPRDWTDLPPVTQVASSAAPFSAYRTFSVLSSRFLGTEHAVRTILDQYAVDESVANQIATRAGEEKVAVPPELVDRVDYAFVGGV